MPMKADDLNIEHIEDIRAGRGWVVQFLLLLESSEFTVLWQSMIIACCATSMFPAEQVIPSSIRKVDQMLLHIAGRLAAPAFISCEIRPAMHR